MRVKTVPADKRTRGEGGKGRGEEGGGEEGEKSLRKETFQLSDEKLIFFPPQSVFKAPNPPDRRQHKKRRQTDR